MFSRLFPITTMWTGWRWNLANKCLIGSCGAESIEPQFVDCSLCLYWNIRRYPTWNQELMVNLLKVFCLLTLLPLTGTVCLSTFGVLLLLLLLLLLSLSLLLLLSKCWLKWCYHNYNSYGGTVQTEVATLESVIRKWWLNKCMFSWNSDIGAEF